MSIESRSWRGVLDTTLCDKVCQWLNGRSCFPPGILVSSTNKTDRLDTTNILLKVALNTITLTMNYKTLYGYIPMVQKFWKLLATFKYYFFSIPCRYWGENYCCKHKDTNISVYLLQEMFAICSFMVVTSHWGHNPIIMQF